MIILRRAGARARFRRTKIPPTRIRISRNQNGSSDGTGNRRTRPQGAQAEFPSYGAIAGTLGFQHGHLARVSGPMIHEGSCKY